MPGPIERGSGPQTPRELLALEERYRPFEPASAWADIRCDADRWGRHADALRDAVRRTDSDDWQRIRDGFLRAAALDSSALAGLIRPAAELTTVVLRGAVNDSAWLSYVEAAGVVVECHRRALVVAADAAAAGRALDEDLIARVQDLIVESQRTYTVTVDGSHKQEVELPRRQYKPVSNYLSRTDQELVPFAPAAQVQTEMSRLTAELASEGFAQLHPVVQAAYTHVALIRIHPFADGNGRLARTLACLPLLRAVGLPQLVLADQWPAYVQALLQSDEGDPRAVVELFLSAQINAMDLARNLLTSVDANVLDPMSAPPNTPERMLLDLVAVHARAMIGVPDPDRRVAVSRGLADDDVVRVVVADENGTSLTDVQLSVETDDGSGWLRVVSTAADVLEVWRDDLVPLPVEIVHLRVRSWLDGVLAPGRRGLPDSTHIRGLFVLGAPRSGTTMIGAWLGSHPGVLGLAEYGGFYIAHSVAPTYLNRLPGQQHEAFLRGVRTLAADEAVRTARRHGCEWFCDATPWNLDVAGAIAHARPDAVFVLMLRHFSGAILSLRQFPWAGDSWADAARLWVSLNNCVDQLPAERAIVVGYDVLAAHPADTVVALREAMESLGLDPQGFDDTVFAASHAHVVGEPRPTVAAVVDGRVVFRPIASVDADRWTSELHAEVWPIVAATHRALLERFAGACEAPPRPAHVPADEW